MQTSSRLTAAVQTASKGIIGIAHGLLNAAWQEAEAQMGFAQTATRVTGNAAGAATSTTRRRGRPPTHPAQHPAGTLTERIFAALPEGRAITLPEIYKLSPLQGVTHNQIGASLTRLVKAGRLAADPARGVWSKIAAEQPARAA